MKSIHLAVLAIGSLAIAACQHDSTAPSSGLAISMASAFSTTPAGTSQLSTSFAASDNDGAFLPLMDRGGMGGHGGFGPPGIGPGFGLGFMGGGLVGPFLGDGIDFFFHDDASCTFSSTTGLTCGPTTLNDGLTVTRVLKYSTASGTVQQKIDSTTNTVATSASVTGTVTRRDSTKSTVNEASSQTISGLAKGSTQRTVNGTSASTENSAGTSQQGAFTALRTAGDTVSGIVIPMASSTNHSPYPTAGSVIRSMAATVTISGQSPAKSSRREVITYDGSATAKVMITENDTTQNCTLPLPHGRLTCQ